MTAHRDISLGQEFRHMREMLELTPQEAAVWLGVPAPVLADIERGEPCNSTDLETCRNIVRHYASMTGARIAPLLRWLSDHFAYYPSTPGLDRDNERNKENFDRRFSTREPVRAMTREHSAGPVPAHQSRDTSEDDVLSGHMHQGSQNDTCYDTDVVEPLLLKARWVVGDRERRPITPCPPCAATKPTSPEWRSLNAESSFVNLGQGHDNGRSYASVADVPAARPNASNRHTVGAEFTDRNASVARPNTPKPAPRSYSTPHPLEYTWFEYGPLDGKPAQPHPARSRHDFDATSHASASSDIGACVPTDVMMEALPRFLQQWEDAQHSAARCHALRGLKLAVPSSVLSISSFKNLWRA